MVIVKENLKDLLEKYIVRINFKKTDGTDRTMVCTLRDDLIGVYEKKTSRERKPNENILSVWDLEKDSHRSFRIDSLISYSVVEEGYEL